jgi:hypothetical protein
MSTCIIKAKLDTAVEARTALALISAESASVAEIVLELRFSACVPVLVVMPV